MGDKNRFRFGQHVLVKGFVWTDYDNHEYYTFLHPGAGITTVHAPESKRGADTKYLLRKPLDPPRVGIVVGRTFRRTGWRWPEVVDSFGFVDTPAQFAVDKQFTVWQVALSLNWTVEVLVEDIEPLSEQEVCGAITKDEI